MNNELIHQKYVGLNTNQKQAADSLFGPVLVIAGAGSGKTASMTVRIAKLIQNGVLPQNILAVTFTRKAANEMTERLELMIGESAIKKVWMGTFHSVCVKILKMHATYLGFESNDQGFSNFTILDSDDQTGVIKKILERMGKTKEIKDGLVKRYISDCKNRLWSPHYAQHHNAETSTDQLCSIIYQEYQEELVRLNCLDFDDLIMKTVELLRDHEEPRKYWQSRFNFVLTDEYQDCNYSQLQLLLFLSAPQFNLFVIGDDSQAIYGFRGSDISIILGFRNMFPNGQVIKLEDNYRSTGVIVEAGNAIIKQNQNQMRKTLRSNKVVGKKIQEVHLGNEFAEAAFLATMIQRECLSNDKKFSDFAILYRSNAQSRVIEDFFRHQFIPTKVVGGQSFYQREEVKDIVAYLRVVFNTKDDVAASRIMNKPARGIGKTTQVAAEEYAFDKKVSVYRAIKNPEDIPSLAKRAQKSLKGYRELIEHFIAKKEVMGAQQLTKYIMSQSGLRKHYEAHEKAEEKIENLNEFLLLIDQYEKEFPDKTMEDYLQEISLITDAKVGEEVEAVQLMTIHASKGLEFPTVFLVGWSEGIFPSSRCTEPSDIEEDRRVAYVAITRAEDNLYITHTHTRKKLDGKQQSHEPSRFLNEIPIDLKDLIEINL